MGRCGASLPRAFFRKGRLTILRGLCSIEYLPLSGKRPKIRRAALHLNTNKRRLAVPFSTNWRSLWRSVVLLLLLVAVVGIVFHNSVFNAAARFLISSDPPEKAGLIYILGGNYLVRAPAGAALYRQGWAPKILLAREPSGRGEDGRPSENFTDVTKRILTENGVPASRITEFFPAAGVRSTADEAHALRLYLEAYPASKILLVTSAFHSRRARMALSRAIPSGTRIVLFAVNDTDCTLANWRDTAHCRNKVETEWLKFGYYFFTFWG